MGSEEFIAKARRFTRSAELLLEDGDYGSVASRCYYAMFLASEAMLSAKGVRTHTHKGMMSLFWSHFVKNGEVAEVHLKALRSVYDLRQRGDYATGVPVDRTDAEVALDKARGFLTMSEAWFGRT
jgi:uncharacterized protein (UPF0332 family)